MLSRPPPVARSVPLTRSYRFDRCEIGETWEEVLDFIREVGVPDPSAIRHSGNGTYFDWLFDKPAIIKSNIDRTAIQDLSRRLQKLIIHLAQKHKRWKFDATHDLARVTRLPGTSNHKTNRPKPVSLLCLNTTRYSLEQLSTLVANLEKQQGLVEQGPKAHFDETAEGQRARHGFWALFF